MHRYVHLTDHPLNRVWFFYLTPGSIVRNTKRVVHRESVNGQQDRYQRYGVSQGVLQD